LACTFRRRFKGIAHAGAIKFLEEQNIRPNQLLEQAQAQ
jgi:hypothetical protein